MEVGGESGGPGCFCRVVSVFFGLVHEEGEFRPGQLYGLECPVAECDVQHPRILNVFDCHPEDCLVGNFVMMRSEFLADIELGEKGLEHGGRMPLHHHSLEVRARFRVLVPGVSVPEMDDKLSGGTVVVSYVWVM